MEMQNESELDYVVRINGVLPSIHTLGDEESSERAAEIKRLGININTSCSLFLMKKTSKSPLPIGSVKNYGSQAESENQNYIKIDGMKLNRFIKENFRNMKNPT